MQAIDRIQVHAGAGIDSNNRRFPFDKLSGWVSIPRFNHATRQTFCQERSLSLLRWQRLRPSWLALESHTLRQSRITPAVEAPWSHSRQSACRASNVGASTERDCAVLPMGRSSSRPLDNPSGLPHPTNRDGSPRRLGNPLSLVGRRCATHLRLRVNVTLCDCD